MDKYLTGGEWKKFCKKPEYKADPLLKAMAALEKAEKQGHDEQLKALDELDRQAEVLLKAHKADKILANYLGEVAKASKKLRADTSAAQVAAERASKAEDDEPPSALLDPKRLLTQLNQCKRDPDRKVNFAFVDAKDKQPACLAMSPKMGSKMLFAKLQLACGVKTGAYGAAWVDGTQLMLKLDKPLSGLVKKIRGPVKECGFRITKAVLWNEDGTVFEQDDEADDDAAASGAPAPKAVPAKATEAPAPTPAPAPASAKAADAPAPADDPSKIFNDRLAALLPRIKSAPADAAQDAKLKASEAGMWARKKDFKQAMAFLDQVEKLLGGAAAKAAPAPASTSAPTPAPAATPGGEAAFTARLNTLVRATQALKGGAHPALAGVAASLKNASALATKKSFEAAAAELDKAEQSLKTIAQAAKAAEPTGGAPDRASERESALRKYEQARAQVLTRLDQLARAVRDSKHPQADRALIEIKAVRANLSARPDTLKAASEVEHYLETDDVVADVDGPNPFGIKIDLQQTLLSAVYELTAALS